MPRSIQFRMLMCNIGAVGALSIILAGDGYSQQTQSPNFGQQQAAPKGGWLTNRLPWKGAAKKPGGSQRPPIQHRNVSPEQKRVGQFSLARLAEKRGQTDAAVTMYQALIQKDPKDAAPYHRLGVIMAKKGDYQAAAQWLIKARSLDPRNVEVLRDMGYLYYKNGRLADAENLYKQGMQLDPKDQGLVNNYAMLLAEKQQYTRSLELFESVNKPAEAHANMGFMLVQLGHLDKAEAYFNHALTLNQDLKSAAHGLMQTAQLKSQVESLRKQSAAVAAAQAPQPAEASLSDEPAAASRIAAASPNNSHVKQVARIEAKTAAPAVQINPIRSGSARTVEVPQSTAPATPAVQSKGRRVVETKSIASPGPARQRNTLRIASTSSSPIPITKDGAKQTTDAKETATRGSSTDGKPSNAQFHWSTSRFPTSQPTWKPNPEKTEVPE